MNFDDKIKKLETNLKEILELSRKIDGQELSYIKTYIKYNEDLSKNHYETILSIVDFYNEDISNTLLNLSEIMEDI